MLSPMPRTSVSVPVLTSPPRSWVRPSRARAAFSYARILKGFSPLSSRRLAISSRMRAASRASTGGGSGPAGRLDQLGQGPAPGEALVRGVPVGDRGLALAPAEANDLIPRHGVEVHEAQVEIAQDASARGDLVQEGAERLELGGAARLLLAEVAHVVVAAGGSGGFDGDQDLDLALEGGDVARRRGERAQRSFEVGDELVGFFHREDPVPDSFHSALV